jgi:hypothetical protein
LVFADEFEHPDLNRNSDIPPVRNATHRCRKWLALKAKRLPHLHPANDGEPDAPSIYFERSGTAVQTCAIVPAFLLEFWVTTFSIEKPFLYDTPRKSA